MRIAGVPEHFNTPLAQCIDEGLFETEVEFVRYPGGTGAMCEALDKGEVDVALLLTEGAVFHACQKGTLKIIGFYVKSPLYWGVHVGAKSKMNELKDIKDNDVKFAISRYGSGSHLMSFILLQNLEEKKIPGFELVGNLDGAKNSLLENPDLVFMWEKFMTAPLVKEGLFKSLGDQPTPWPCFSIAVSNKFMQNLVQESDINAFKKVFSTLQSKCAAFKSNPDTTKTLTTEFSIEESLGREWLEQVEYDCDISNGPELETIQGVAAALHSVGKLEKLPSSETIRSFVHKL